MKKNYNDIEFWKPIYEEYINGKSSKEIYNIYRIKPETIKKYFLKFNFQLKTKEQIKQELVLKRKKTCLEKYGVECSLSNNEIKEKKKKTLLERYGVDHPSKSNEIKEKKKKTLLERYGVDHPSKSNEIKEKKKKTLLERYGVDNPLKDKNIKKKVEQTCLKKYGFKSPLKNESIKNKIKKTNLDNYGVEHFFQREDIKKKTKYVNLEKYGVDHPSKRKEIKEKTKKTNIEIYGTESPLQNKSIREKIKKTIIKKHFYLLLQKIKNEYEFLDSYKGTQDNDHKWISYKFKCLKCSHIFETPLYQGQPKCPICYPVLLGKSKLEDEIESFINSLGFKTERNIRILDKKEIDIFIPEKQIGIEINGIYYHNSNPDSHSYKDKDYHKQKTDLARKKGIKLIHIWDCFNVKIYKSMIRNLLGKTENKIYARKCQIKKITKEEERLFLEQNHIHGYTQSNKSLGLFYQNELVSVISFRRHKEGVEIARFASKLNTNIIGGFSRLLKHSNINDTIITYCDIEFCPFMTDSVYFKNGFTFVKETSPKLYFTDFKQIFNRQEFMKHKLKNKLERYDENLTAEENLFLNDIYPVYSTGNWKLIKIFK